VAYESTATAPGTMASRSAAIAAIDDRLGIALCLPVKCIPCVDLRVSMRRGAWTKIDA